MVGAPLARTKTCDTEGHHNSLALLTGYVALGLDWLALRERLPSYANIVLAIISPRITTHVVLTS